jgi:proteasome accessory factor B
MTKPTKLQRQLDLIAYLVGRRFPVSVEELMENVPAYAEKWRESDTARATARRTFERDKDELRAFGIPLRTVRYTIDRGVEEVEGYEIQRRDFYLPYLKLVSQLSGERPYSPPARAATLEIERDDAPLALRALQRIADVPNFPLAREARSAFRKLAFDLDPDAFTEQPDVVFADRINHAELTANLRTLSDALLKRKTVTFQYRGIYRGEETSRDVNGYGLLYQSGHWYLVGHDTSREDIRIFRAARMSDVVANKKAPNTPDYVLPEDFRLDDYVGRQPWELGDQDEPSITARVLFRFPASLWAERNGHGTWEQTHANGSAVRAFTVHQTNPFVRWLLGMQDDVEVLEPAALSAELKAIAQRVVDLHAEEDHERE